MSKRMIDSLELELEVLEGRFNILQGLFEDIMNQSFRDPEKAMRVYSADDQRNPRGALRRMLNDGLDGRVMRYGRLKGSPYSISQKKRDERAEAREELEQLPDLIKSIKSVEQEYRVTLKAINRQKAVMEAGENQAQSRAYVQTKKGVRNVLARRNSTPEENEAQYDAYVQAENEVREIQIRQKVFAKKGRKSRGRGGQR